jgi:hypothetical protein
MTKEDLIVRIMTDAAMVGADKIEWDLPLDDVREHIRAAMFTALRGIYMNEAARELGALPGEVAWKYNYPHAI